MTKPRVLFVSTYQGARSRIAEEFTRQAASGRIDAYSASFESGIIDHLAVAVMKEVGIDLPTESPKSVFDRFRDNEVFDYVVTLCPGATTGQCAVFKTSVDMLYGKNAERLSWSVPDFKSLSGTDDEQKAGARRIRDQIKREVWEFLSRPGINAGIA